MLKPRPLPLFCAALFGVALIAPAMAQTATTDAQTIATATMPASKLISTYSHLAGSDANAQALIDGLRNGSAITLNTPTTTTVTNPDGTTTTTTTPTGTTFTPTTGKMGWGEVNITLSLAQALVGSDATAARLQAAVNGGTITNADGTTSTLTGILTMRASGTGWGQIAKQLGFNLGSLVSASHTGKSAAGQHAAKPDKAGKVAKSDVARAEHPAHPEHASPPEHQDRPSKPERPSRPEVPSHPGRGG